jgi:hypothetical protein
MTRFSDYSASVEMLSSNSIESDEIICSIMLHIYALESKDISHPLTRLLG